jgi:tetratricopeptide (TPR) repeat protein
VPLYLYVSNPTVGIHLNTKSIFKIITLVICLAIIAGGIFAYSKGYYHAIKGGLSQGRGDLDQAIIYFQTAYKKNPESFMVAYDLAGCYALKGENDSCFHWLHIALKSSYGNCAKNSAKSEKDFDSIRETSEFRSLIYDSP